MGECNYCTFKRIKSKVNTATHKIVKIASTGQLKGVDIYVCPKLVNVRRLSVEDRKQYWRIWFMQLPKKCCC
jgi:hypothetical protein